MQTSIWNAHYMCRSMQEYVCVRSPFRGCFRWIEKNAKKLKRTMFQQSAANLSFFTYRLHNEMLDKKINSIHDCQDYIKLFNFSESKFQEISSLPRTARVQYFEKRMAVIIQPLCMLAHARSHSRRSNLVTHAIGQVTKIFSITFTANFRFKLAIWWGWHETSDYLGGAPSKRFATLRNVPINSASSSSLVLPSALGPVSRKSR